ncbi:MAG: hypothetical protein ACF8XB_13590 [Planctomycetota bacterium JB042]
MTRPTARVSCAFALSVLVSLASATPALAQDPPDHLIQAPPVAPLGAAKIHVHPNGFRVGRGPFVPEAEYPLLRAIAAAEALHVADPATVVLEVHGAIPAPLGQQIGGGAAGLKPYRVAWKAAPIDVAVRGATGPYSDSIPGFVLLKDLTDGTGTTGVLRFRVENLAIRGTPFGHSVVSTPNGLPPTLGDSVYPTLQIYGCRIEKGDGQPNWGARLHGRARFDFRDNHFSYMAEHSAYIDSPQGDSYFLRNTTSGSTRTMLQVVNRSTANPGPSGHGLLLVEGNLATNVDGSGGSDFTVAGHLGTVIFRKNVSYQGAGQSGSQGSIVVYTDASPRHGAHLDDAGFSTTKVIVQGHTVVAPDADRDHVMLSGAATVEIRDGFLVVGSRTAFHFDSEYGGPVKNGSECFVTAGPASSHPGFMSALKVRRSKVVLSPMQIDALWCP